MIFKKLKLTNFKGIKETVTIPLAPITLLFGGNSSGKSTVLQSFLYLYEILINKDLSPEKTLKQGKGCVIGSFDNLIHQKDLANVMSIEVELDASGSILESYLEESDEMFIQEFSGRTESFGINEPSIDTISLKLDVAYNNEDGPYVKQVTVCINDKQFAEIRREASSKQIWLVLDQECVENLNELYDDESISKIISDGVGGGSFIYLDKMKQAVPDSNNRLVLSDSSWTDSGYFGDNPMVTKLVLESILSQLISAPFKLLKRELEKLLHIGPVREVPIRGYAPNKKSTDWYNGLAAWDMFAHAEDSLQNKVNEVFGVKGFCSKYKFITKGFYNHVVIRDEQLGIFHEPSELGIGISQVFPFVVALSDRRAKFVSVEQPELHIHPGWQLVLGDLLIDAIKNSSNRMFLIETHSEHLMLRLLNRVRNQVGDDGYNSELSINPEDLSVVCVYLHEGSPHYQRQIVTSDGDFELDWPEGFFEERYGEN